MSRRLIILGLDGFEISLAEAMMASGDMPHMARLAETASVFDLDHGRAKATGLAWEHVATGRGPGEGGRWSALTFDPERYTVRQDVTSAQPVFADLADRMVVFDAPYFDLARSGARGMTNWGAHDPGVSSQASPAGQALRGIYREIDAMCGTLREVAPDAGILVFAMHGMGTNQADIPSMVLLPELMFRLAFGRSHAGPPAWRQTLPGGVPFMEPHEDWFKVMQGLMPSPAHQALRRRLA